MAFTENQQREAATKFSNDWRGLGNELSDYQRFWIELLSNVFGIEDATRKIDFQKRVVIEGHTKYIDAYIPETRVLIEQKSLDVDLNKKHIQSDGSLRTAFEQGRNYAQWMTPNETPLWIVTCNFKSFEIHDMNKPQNEPLVILLEDLRNKLPLFDFMFRKEVKELSYEMDLSFKAGEIVGVIYDKLLEQYINPDASSLMSLNELCVRLVFCLYAEDAGIFNGHALFHDYLEPIPVSGMRRALEELFKVLDTDIPNRNKYLAQDNPILASFPYVNGGLFSNENIEIPPFTEEIKDILLNRASAGFNWSEISPTIFGAVFESTLNPETRRSGGMHYTTIETIHKVIDPLFLDNLNQEFLDIKEMKTRRADGSINPIPYAKKMQSLEEFQGKLSDLIFLDPACGSGNFLTETYISLRRLENKVIKEKYEYQKGAMAGQIMFSDLETVCPIKVSINQFYGIEINDFAVTVAMTALWIAESQMMKETEDIIHMPLDFLPLTTNAFIKEGNALRIDWEDIVSSSTTPLGVSKSINYIIGNPPFVSQGGSSDRGQRHDGAGRGEEQKEDMKLIFGNKKGTGNLDYVACWFQKASEFMQKHPSVETAFVSTNSICQGQQVQPLWEDIFKIGIKINFAHQSFIWDSESGKQAVVYIVIIGFSMQDRQNKVVYKYNKYKGDAIEKKVSHINAYLLEDAPDVFIGNRTKPLEKNTSKMMRGGGVSDWGYLMLSLEEKDALIKAESAAEKWIKPYLQGNEFIKNIQRYCLWLEGITPRELNQLPMVKKRVQGVKEKRLESKKASTRKKAETPWLFDEIIRVDSEEYIAVPQISAGTRRYIPMGYVSSENIAGNKLLMIPGGSLYEFGVLCSNVHNAWVRVVASHYGPSYQYSVNVAYNNFPWPTPSEEQKIKIEETAQGILDARALYPNDSLEDLYDPLLMPKELSDAHKKNDITVMRAYGFTKDTEAYSSETSCVVELMKMYVQKTEGEN